MRKKLPSEPKRSAIYQTIPQSDDSLNILLRSLLRAGSALPRYSDVCHEFRNFRKW